MLNIKLLNQIKQNFFNKPTWYYDGGFYIWMFFYR